MSEAPIDLMLMLNIIMHPDILFKEDGKFSISYTYIISL